jgi:septal ring factor EnvC (AmiA/AmiB activator)
MADRRWTTILLVFLSLSVLSAQTAERLRTESQARRANERLTALQREAAELAARERSLLIDLRRLEVERDLRTEQLKKIDSDTELIARELGDTGNRIDALEAQELELRPVLETRMVELYKLGSAGYVRILFNVSDLKEFGRAYRMVSALAAIDRQRMAEHQQTLAELGTARTSLEKRRGEMAKLQQAAQTARTGAERAATARSQLIAQIDQRRDLMAELAGELQMAQQRLQQTLGAINAGVPRAATEGSALPIRPFRGVLEWPATGRVMSRFGRPGATVSSATAQNGIQLAVQEGMPVRAVHDGTVAFSGPFTGYGNLVIVDHGTDTYSLYGQLGDLQVNQGARIDRGHIVGTVGRVLAGIPGVYFEMRVDGKPVDPLEWLKKTP